MKKVYHKSLLVTTLSKVSRQAAKIRIRCVYRAALHGGKKRKSE